MLILTRKIGQTIRIGENVQVTLLSVDRHRIKIGIEAPRDVTILRDELVNRGSASKKRQFSALVSLFDGQKTRR